MERLPSDLERLGEVLTDATQGAVAARAHRHDAARRLVACLLAGILVFAVTAPGRLVSSDRGGASHRTFAFVGLPGSDDLGGPCDTAHGGAGRYFQAPAGCTILKPPPQAR